jgi:hypothetical protein
MRDGRNSLVVPGVDRQEESGHDVHTQAFWTLRRQVSSVNYSTRYGLISSGMKRLKT